MFLLLLVDNLQEIMNILFIFLGSITYLKYRNQLYIAYIIDLFRYKYACIRAHYWHKYTLYNTDSLLIIILDLYNVKKGY